ncbi:lipoyl(octanoyl) transferase LipB [Oceanispirochaeta sp.]|jgi:lipoyl(octanoyl) transferase|uniref:lipoyl(octanoyl) transferase LipB n=1 Tax=Oceanispirochaeta sp. TaxID=2035350 RepID=UPI00260A16EB|nr:lipoyl(octanoyl) transferase LipB [Oceanispirochaeta sp.]MDA3956032.1 lipoyl(octanoyl) transferase LipB [Oceanispirochaeta sp.]
MKLTVYVPGQLSYEEALDWQYDLVDKRREGVITDTLILLEHPPVLTTGRREQEHNILIDASSQDIPVIKTNRGGEVTYHGPGQLVGYLIVDLSSFSRRVKQFVFNLEDVFVRFLDREYGIQAQRYDKHRGVWVGDDKITAIGLAIEREITMHGFAFNINTNLDHFKWIVPCGIQDKGVTSLEKITGKTQDMDRIIPEIAGIYKDVFGYDSMEMIYGR